MLSRTAANLFWLARYMERADNAARLIGVAQRMSSINPSSDTEWRSALTAAGVLPDYEQKFGAVTPHQALDYMVSDLDNGSSILSCLGAARRNARSVRTALTADMWEAVNGTWLELPTVHPTAALRGETMTRFLEWTKSRTSLFNGAYANSMLRNDAYFFTKLGVYLERADNTARILDVKYHVLLPRPDAVGGVIDYYQWTAILRAVSALRAYPLLYSGRIQPWNVAELLILRPELPRSLRFSYERVLIALQNIDGTPSRAQSLATPLYTKMHNDTIKTVFEQGLHDYLTEVIDATDALGAEIVAQYL